MSTAGDGGMERTPPLDPSAREVPSALRARVAAALERHAADAGHGGAVERAAACLAAGEALLADVLRQPERARGAALDLLASDALVTYAFELLADAPERLEADAEAAMRRIAMHGDAAAA